MCEACFREGVYRFLSAQAFAAFELRLFSKGLLLAQRPASWPAPQAFSLLEPVQYYRCPRCHQVWALSYPENAWRGYFLPDGEAWKYVTQLRRQEKRQQVGCIAVLGSVLLVLLWWLLT